MKRYNKIKKIALSCGMLITTCAFTSCEDFLTIYPTTQIVEENFWEDRADLESVVAACYARMVNADMVRQYIVYGEVRSDNFNPQNEGVNLFNMMNANLLPTEGHYDWTSFYQVINWCNRVLERGENVVARDESFSMGDWLPIRAEMTTLRALNYFYLVRVWGNVPLELKAYFDDSQKMNTAQSSQETVLNRIIADLERVRGEALQKYTTNRFTKGRITQKAINALLADVYLWRAAYYESTNPEQAATDYRKAIEYCDLVIERAKVERLELFTDFVSSGETITIKEEDLLVTPNSFLGSLQTYDLIFGTGNSTESIFELQFDGNSGNNNSSIASLYGSQSGVGSLVPSLLFRSKSTNVNGDANSVFYKTDLRRWESVQYTGPAQIEYPIAKYVSSRISQELLPDNDQASLTNTSYILRPANSNSANWIFYRMSEIFLIKAEAISRLHNSDVEELRRGFNYLSMVSKRSNVVATVAGSSVFGDTIRFSGVNTGNDLENLVMAERQREFFCEGKRWFDLVRYAQRRGNTKEMLDLLVRKYDSNKNAIRSKLGTMNSLFFPISDGEIRKNKALLQNPAWETSSNVSKN